VLLSSTEHQELVVGPQQGRFCAFAARGRAGTKSSKIGKGLGGGTRDRSPRMVGERASTLYFETGDQGGTSTAPAMARAVGPAPVVEGVGCAELLAQGAGRTGDYWRAVRVLSAEAR